MPFLKMHGAGNDFVMLNGVTADLTRVNFASLASTACDRRFGVGSDGLIVVDRGSGEAFRMRMWNPDCSDGGMCGNGTRCVLLMLEILGIVGDGPVSLEVGDRVVSLERVSADAIQVEMGRPTFLRGEIGMTGDPGSEFTGQVVGGLEAGAASMGNPHLVLFVDDVAGIALETRGQELEHYRDFPSRTNVHFVQVISRSEIKVRHWERGAGATLACGSGACAAFAVAQRMRKIDMSVVVHVPGGQLRIEADVSGNLSMMGPAVLAFTGFLAETPLL